VDSDQPDAETSVPDNTQHLQMTDIHAPGVIRTRHIRKRTATDPRPSPRSHWDRFFHTYISLFLARRSSVSYGFLSFTRFPEHTRRTTLGKIPLDEWSTRRRDLYMTTYTLTTENVHAPGGIRTHHIRKRSTTDPRLRPQGHWDRFLFTLVLGKLCGDFRRQYPEGPGTGHLGTGFFLGFTVSESEC
jgi:hypothetical protein